MFVSLLIIVIPVVFVAAVIVIFVLVNIFKFFTTALQKKPKDLNVKAADMWSFAVTLWEMATREVPFADLTPMEAGMKVLL